MSTRKPPTDDEIEASAWARRNDPDAWEVLPFVPASSSPRPEWMLRKKHLEVAAKFYVLSALHRYGVEANLALAEPNDVDITGLSPAGMAITIDVKVIQGAEWSVDRFTARKHHYIVVVAFNEAVDGVVDQPAAYVVASESLRKFVARNKMSRLPLATLASELHALEAWQLVAAERAA